MGNKSLLFTISDKVEVVMAMLGAQAEAQEKADTYAQAVLEQARLEKSDAYDCQCHECRTGDCCRIPVLTTPLDVMPIAWHIHTSGMNEHALRRRYIEQGQATIRTLLESTKDADVLPCVLLQGDNTCEHYARRPIACRVHYVINGPDVCRPYVQREDGRRPLVNLIDTGDMSMFAVFMAQGAMKACGCVNADEFTWLQPLGLQLGIALEALVAPAQHFIEYLATHSSMPEHLLQSIFNAQQSYRNELIMENSEKRPGD